MKKETPIQKAIRIAGGQAAMARLLGVKPQHVQAYVKYNRAAAKRVLDIERACGGEVSRYELRPDIYGPPPAK